MYSSCLVASKFVLWKINSGAWFVQIFLQKMHYIAKSPNFPYISSVVNVLIMNQFHTHSQKKQNPAKKENQIRSNWDRAAEEKVRSEARSERRRDRVARSEARSSGGGIEAARSSDAVLRLTSGAVLRLTSGTVLRSTISAVRSSDWSSVCGRWRSLFFLSLCDLGSFSLLFAWVFSFCGSLSLLRVLRKMFEGKMIM